MSAASQCSTHDPHLNAYTLKVPRRSSTANMLLQRELMLHSPLGLILTHSFLLASCCLDL
jgi:hypothetical protein